MHHHSDHDWVPVVMSRLFSGLVLCCGWNRAEVVLSQLDFHAWLRYVGECDRVFLTIPGANYRKDYANPMRGRTIWSSPGGWSSRTLYTNHGAIRSLYKYTSGLWREGLDLIHTTMPQEHDRILLRIITIMDVSVLSDAWIGTSMFTPLTLHTLWTPRLTSRVKDTHCTISRLQDMLKELVLICAWLTDTRRQRT